jgi:hypothetical protein
MGSELFGNHRSSALPRHLGRSLVPAVGVAVRSRKQHGVGAPGPRWHWRAVPLIAKSACRTFAFRTPQQPLPSAEPASDSPLPRRVAILGAAMDVIEDYRRRAAEVAKLALTAASEEHRRQILKIAETWTILAAQREKMIREGWVPRVRRDAEIVYFP